MRSRGSKHHELTLEWAKAYVQSGYMSPRHYAELVEREKAKGCPEVLRKARAS